METTQEEVTEAHRAGFDVLEIEYGEALAISAYIRDNEEQDDGCGPFMSHWGDTARYATGGSWLTGVACYSVSPVTAEQAAKIGEALKAHGPRFDSETFQAVVAEQLSPIRRLT